MATLSTRRHLLTTYILALVPFCASCLSIPPDSVVTAAVALLDDGDFDASKQYFDTAIANFDNTESNEDYLNAVKDFGKALRSRPGLQKEACKIFNYANNILETDVCSTEEWNLIGSIHLNSAYTYDKMLGDIHGAVKPYERAIYVYDQQLGESSLYIAAYIYQPLANIYTRFGDYAASEILLERSLKIYTQDENLHFIIAAHSDLSILYETWGKYDIAEKYFLDGLNHAVLPNMNRALLLINYGDFLYTQEQFTKSQEIISEVLSILENELSLEEPDPQAPHYFGYCLIKNAQLQGRSNINLDVSEEVNEGLDSMISFFGTPFNREIGKAHIMHGGIHLTQNAPHKALQKFQEAIHAVLPDYAPTTQSPLPDPTSFYAENTIMEGLDGLSLAYEAMYQESKQSAHLDLALQCQDLIYEVEKNLRRSYLYESAKLFNLEESRLRNSRAINLCLQLHEISNDPAYQWKAFEIAERNRSTLLREAFNSDRATSFAGLTDAQLQEESDLKMAVSQAEEVLFSLKSESAADSLLEQAKQELLAANESFSRWIQDLETINPQYYQAKYLEQAPTLASIRQWLQKNETLVEYFLGEEEITFFVVNHDGLQIFQKPISDQLPEQVLAFRHSIDQYQMEGSDKTSLAANYQTLGVDLYQLLIQPIEPAIKNVEKLLIIPSGVLDILPFDALLTGTATNTRDFNTYPYLLHQYSIRYGYSTALLQTLHEQPLSGQGWAGFVPDFGNTPDWDLLSESRNFITSFEGKKNHYVYLDDFANIDNFKARVPFVNILQLATHAQANAENGNFSFIVFSDGNGGYDSLYTKDLYLLKIQAELVILSACETALGTLYDSEGVISLARGFHYAGGRSVITTLWEVNEATTMYLVKDIYAFLDEGYSKDEALHQAKLQYFETADSRAAHPAFWAGMQLTGNPRPIKAENYFVWYCLAATLGIIFLMRGFILRKKRTIHDKNFSNITGSRQLIPDGTA